MADKQSDAERFRQEATAALSQLGAKTPEQRAAEQAKRVKDAGFVQVGGDRIAKGDVLGVQPGYVAPYTGQRRDFYGEMDAAAGVVGVPARYGAADLDAFAGMSPEFVAELQGALGRAGLVNKVPKGIWDTSTANAMEKVLSYANQRGLLWQDALREWSEAGAASGMSSGGGGGGGARGPVFTPRLSNPDDLRKLFKQMAYNQMGGQFIDDAQVEKFVTNYQGAELAAQRQQFNAATRGGESVDSPNAQTVAESQIKDDNTAGVEAHSIMQYGRVLENLLGGGA